MHAKKVGVKTGEVLWSARLKCPNLVVVPPNFDQYLRFSKLAREIYGRYTDKIESFGLDECWLDVTGSKIFGSGLEIANQIKNTIYKELGVTVSIGVSWNKIFAKLGSDMHKPNKVTQISKENYKITAWNLPVSSLIYVGKATKQKLNNLQIKTIGDLANYDVKTLEKRLGKWGVTLGSFANGQDLSNVDSSNSINQIKSVGNSTTTPFDMVCNDDVKVVLYILCESVASRLRAYGQKCTTVQITIKDKTFHSFERQAKLLSPTYLAKEIFDLAFSIFQNNYNFTRNTNGIRSIGVRGCNLVRAYNNQLCFFEDEEKRIKNEKLERAIDILRARFGYYCIKKGIYVNNKLAEVNPREEHIIHPVSYFK